VIIPPSRNLPVTQILSFVMKKMIRPLMFLLFALAFSNQIFAQLDPTLSIQGILKKSNGVAVEDGNYNLVFKLYTTETGGTAIWMETQPAVEVSNGIYSAVLGVITPLNVPFNQLYYLGVTVGSTELTPRILLTSAPYALSLIGQTNKFPSSGIVVADSIRVNGGVLARGGIPGANGANRNGYAFSGSNDDKESGLFSTASGEVSLFANNVKVVTATATGISVAGDANVAGTVTSDFLRLNANGDIAYNGIHDWRLVDVDNFETDSEGWACFANYNSNTSASFDRVGSTNPINTGFVLRPTDQGNNAMRKQLDFTGIPHQYVKVKFTFLTFGTYDPGDVLYGAFSTVATPDYNSGGQAWIGWNHVRTGGEVIAFRNGTDGHGYNMRGEMEIKNSANTIWLILDSTMNEAASDESYGISNIEIWVK
jgi:hypothetical protein